MCIKKTLCIITYLIVTAIAATAADFTVLNGTFTIDRNAILSLDVAGDIVIGNGNYGAEFNGGYGNISLTGNWSKTDPAVFNYESSTITFYNSSIISTISGGTTFYCFNCVTPNKQINKRYCVIIH